ncbi:DNA-binding response regulator [Christiangramia fulva]|uniref:DNA-binding response regulator n=1 Tax=Christiangramia fulva TaxID=2126553 RepID=A0A2R3ZAZ4_9FLAO|nr:LytTR family DNA-binding domain-containing protein [Christiangramia fulva]AVR47468.1 DNA-binding response regulator [Christiangramia fulva]
MEVVIIEDEKPAARRLQRMLERIDISAGTMLHSVAEAVEWFHKNPDPDLIFLDIQLGDGLSFEIFDFVQVRSPIIFTTAYDEYALKAFKLNSIDYLLKPIDEEELESAVNKFREQQKDQNGIPVAELRSLLKLQNGSTYKTRFMAQVGQHIRLVEVREIACFYSENKSSFIHSFSGRNFPVEISLENVEKELDPSKFFRINRKCIINIEAIKDIVHFTNSRLEIKLADFNDFQLIVSRERVKDFKKWLDS